MTNGQVLDLHTLALGGHTLTVYAVDKAGYEASASVTFSVTATIKSLMTSVNRFYDQGKIDSHGLRNSLLAHLQGYAPAVAIEFARKLLFSRVRPSFSDLETQLNALRLRCQAHVLRGDAGGRGTTFVVLWPLVVA